MAVNQNEYDELFHQLQELLRKQRSMQKDILQLQEQLSSIEIEKENQTKQPIDFQEEEEIISPSSQMTSSQPVEQVVEPLVTIEKKREIKRSALDFEKLIGENIANKIGIVILVIGAAIGAKYAIDRELISPLTRIILGYLLGLGLLGFAIRLKSKFENFSAVLLSGSMAILYFITFAAHSFYGLIPSLLAFLIMVVFTVFTVLASLQYNREIIALFGLVGAYAIPFLLGSEDSDVRVLFTYMSIINTGILFIAIKKYWKALFYWAFLISWALFFSWYLSNYSAEKFSAGMGFSFLFFVIFYITFLVYKVMQKEQFNTVDVLFVLLNSFLFYFSGYGMVSELKFGADYLGFFTVLNAVVHFLVSTWIYRQKLVDKKVLYLAIALVITFLTIAIPVQLSGNWVTLLWVVEAAILFWIARNKQLPFYEFFAYGLMVFALASMASGWLAHSAYSSNALRDEFLPFFNQTFLVSLLFTAAFSWITFIFFWQKTDHSNELLQKFRSIYRFLIPSIFIYSLFQTFSQELNNIFMIKYAKSYEQFEVYNINYKLLGSIWKVIYSLLFTSAVSFVNFKRFNSKSLGIIISFFLFLFIGNGVKVSFGELVELRNHYLDPQFFFPVHVLQLGIRYLVFAGIAIAVYQLYNNQLTYFKEKKSINYFEVFVYALILIIITNELLHWMALYAPKQIQDLWVDILWGAYALALIGIGIKQKKRHLRVAAIVLFGLTLLKLFLKDFYFLDTLARTIVLISLGILLLITSFLYNRFKNLVTEDEV